VRPAPRAASTQPASRKPEKGAVTPQRKAKSQEPTKIEPPKPGERVCPTCGTGNDPERKFCRRCGNAVGAAAIETASPPPAPAHERQGPGFFGRLGRQARQEASMAASSPQSLTSAPSRLRMRGSLMVYGLLGIFGLGALASYYYMPGVGETVDGVIDDVRRTIENRVGERSEINITRAQAQSEPGFPAVNMIDGGSNTWWAGEVSQNGRWQLDFFLQEPTDLLQVNIDAGADGEAYDQLGRPKEIQIRANQELSPRYTLSDTNDHQPIEIDVQGVEQLRIIVHSAYIGLETDDVIAVREVSFVGPKD
jgi:hypothetical protein